MVSSIFACGFIYFIRAVGSGCVKIGYAGTCSTDRIAALQVDCPHELRLIAELRAPRLLEREIHDLFRRFWVRGEWFHEDSPLHEFIALAVQATEAGFADSHSRPLIARDRLSKWLVDGFTGLSPSSAGPSACPWWPSSASVVALNRRLLHWQDVYRAIDA